MLELAQIWSVLFWLIANHVVTFKAMSQRQLEQMRKPKIFLFGRCAPAFLYVLMIAIVYR